MSANTPAHLVSLGSSVLVACTSIGCQKQTVCVLQIGYCLFQYFLKLCSLFCKVTAFQTIFKLLELWTTLQLAGLEVPSLVEPHFSLWEVVKHMEWSQKEVILVWMELFLYIKFFITQTTSHVNAIGCFHYQANILTKHD